MTQEELLKMAKEGIEDFDIFIEGLKQHSIDNIEVLAAISAIAAMRRFVSLNKLSEVFWIMVDFLSDINDPTFLRLLRMKQVLFPESKSRYISITPEIFKTLQEEAKALLEAMPDATDDKRYYWKSIIKGKVPPGIIVEDI